jgi:hypothetical protein
MIASTRGRQDSIERATLIKIARDTAAQRMAARPSILSAYLIGSVGAGEPMLGGATDIDLVLIDASPPPAAREVIRLTDQIALDLHHRHRDQYTNAKLLRGHPWLGPELAEPLFLHDPTHFFELAQASARGQFHRPDHVAARARGFVSWARAELHVGLLPGMEPDAPVTLANYGQALLFAANAAITLTAFPAAGRRLAMKLEAAARKLQRPDLYDGFLALLAGPQLERAAAEPLLAGWLAAYRAGQTSTDEIIHPARRTIYERGFRAQIEADRAADMAWLMLVTWNACRDHLPHDPQQDAAWQAFLSRLALVDPAAYTARVAQAIDYVTNVADLVEKWADSNGV